jgi:ABC-type transport system involved in Fe-S cluster assembly fused permease/ATPase subunit
MGAFFSYENVIFENRGISFMVSSMVFHVLPTALEISMVCGILVRRIK